MEPPLIVVVATVTVAVLTVVALVLSQRRTRRQIDALMRRIDELERRGAAPLPSATAGAPVDPSPAEFNPAADAPERLSRDVLAGRTSFVRRAVEGELDRPASLAGQAIALVDSKVEENLLPAELAAELAISLRTLERRLGAELACTPRQLILAMKMREARRLLGSGRFRVNEVASRLGFATPSHFSRSFRDFYRVPPSELIRAPRP